MNVHKKTYRSQNISINKIGSSDFDNISRRGRFHWHYTKHFKKNHKQFFYFLLI